MLSNIKLFDSTNYLVASYFLNLQILGLGLGLGWKEQLASEASKLRLKLAQRIEN